MPASRPKWVSFPQSSVEEEWLSQRKLEWLPKRRIKAKNGVRVRTTISNTRKEKEDSQISVFCGYELMIPLIELGNTGNWTAFEGNLMSLFWLYWVYTSRWISGLGSYMTLVLWREICTANSIVGIYHHIGGSWNYRNGWDHPGYAQQKRRSQ